MAKQARVAKQTLVKRRQFRVSVALIIVAASALLLGYLYIRLSHAVVDYGTGGKKYWSASEFRLDLNDDTNAVMPEGYNGYYDAGGGYWTNKYGQNPVNPYVQNWLDALAYVMDTKNVAVSGKYCVYYKPVSGGNPDSNIENGNIMITVVNQKITNGVYKNDSTNPNLQSWWSSFPAGYQNPLCVSHAANTNAGIARQIKVSIGRARFNVTSIQFIPDSTVNPGAK